MKIILMCAIAVPLLYLTGCSSSNTLRDNTDEASALHRSMTTIDTHADTPLRLMRGDYDAAQWHDPADDDGKIDFPRMRQGGLDAEFFAAFIAQGPRTPAGNENAARTVMAIIDTIHSVVSRNPQAAVLALASPDASRIKAEGKCAVYIGIENGYALGNDISLVRKYYDRGVRYITLCHSKDNDICDSSSDADTVKYNGLSEFGKNVVREMNDIGMIIDVSHVSDSSFYDVIALSKTPVIASHSCAHALCSTPRNMKDDLLKALAVNGGVIQVCFVSEFLKTPGNTAARDSALKALRQKYADDEHHTADQRLALTRERNSLNIRYPKQLPSVSDVVDHIDHIVAVAGIDHVGIGTDFDGGGEVVGCSDVSEMKHITVELLRRGYSHGDIRKIWGGNFLRVFGRIEAYADVRREQRGR